jgi:hypothetical protein
MSQPDPIVEEVRRVREAYAARFNFDVRAMFEDVKRQERESGCKSVSSEPKLPARGESERE